MSTLAQAGGLLAAIVAGEAEGEEIADWAGGHRPHFSAFTQRELAASAGFTVSGSQPDGSHFHEQAEQHWFMFAQAA